MGKSCPKVITVDFPSLSYMSTGMLSYTIVSASILSSLYVEHHPLTSQNSLINCRHMPHGLAGGLMSVDTAIARMSPFFAPYSGVSSCTRMSMGRTNLDNSSP